MKKDIRVTEAARNYPVACFVPDGEKICTGLDLASALAGVDLTNAEAKAWHSDLWDVRQHLKSLPDK